MENLENPRLLAEVARVRECLLANMRAQQTGTPEHDKARAIFIDFACIAISAKAGRDQSDAGVRAAGLSLAEAWGQPKDFDVATLNANALASAAAVKTAVKAVIATEQREGGSLRRGAR